MITQQTAPNEAYQKLDELANKHTEQLRKLTKQVQEHRTNGETDLVKRSVMEYEECLEHYIPVLMAQAKIYWDLENYAQVEKIFRKSVEFCNDNDVWRLNVAHVLFMQENKFKEATGFYEPIVKKNYSDVGCFFFQCKLTCCFFADFKCKSYSFGESLRFLYNDVTK